MTGQNIEELIEWMDILLDATDNMETRYIINDACVKHHFPWIYSAVLRTYGMTLPILPREGACLRCLWKENPSPGSMETCATAGILPTIPRLIANVATTEVLKYLVGKKIRTELLIIDPWNKEYNLLDIKKTPHVSHLCHSEFSVSREQEFPHYRALWSGSNPSEAKRRG